MKAPRLGSEEVSYSDRISYLPDDLLLRILSFIHTSDAISTSLLSKRWKFVWKMMPTLDLDEDSCRNIGTLRFDEGCCMFLKSHEAPVLTSLNLKLMTPSHDIDRLLSNIKPILHEITITSYRYSTIRFPRNLNVCQTLVVMKLQDKVLVDVSFPVCFRSLKSLHLTRVKYSCRESFTTLLSACPVLEDLDLFIGRVHYDCLNSFTIWVPSLQRLSICDESYRFRSTTFEISVPSLKYLKIACQDSCFKFVEDMPNLVEAHVEANQHETKNLLRFLTSVERLKDPDLTDRIFHQLLYLELHLHKRLNGDRILSLLKHSPNLQTLKLNEKPLRSIKDQPNISVRKPNSVPECLTFHLETLEWQGYAGRPEDKEIAVYILGNALRLNTATISRYFSSSRFRHHQKKDLKIVEELKSITKASTSCQLVLQQFIEIKYSM
ncbi:F-box-like domain superfamily [Arabidopsis thaliana x Arabidopsis arenosa]|uniref:Putative FBD-associated F-box protein At5g56820 n=3 Tax=Arabidopsis TaxID=3701 RepID=FBD29_ARATH|nr:F-box/RNI-like/FBD-like domains-containing protein [Arabidopsis thaliana]Q9FJT1.2 RecName: Full=Putative FBD-associated F-box protein At5g56820 [Arabidopsis thaliana]AED96811.1 F-box/RNI-like/FBD-like domains-containing protein [Arabidopsis thaliana]KAG7606342.1 F-box-like domain superfamily [Arabidopsis thaliana x Arabidopsis arenosa]KAG7613256.1 F-box-like domain superfamily [Arabidopsis suecica]|eukprot:NP_200493.2 F-box/RNI-like/FBD-like domains-containing protein [Arabidopsis thaliana]